MRILLATDGSPHALRAAEWLKSFPVPHDATVSVLAVGTLRAPLAELPSVEALRRLVLEGARKVSQQTHEALKSRWPLAELLEAEGDPREEIIRAADDRKADLLVMGARGAGGFRKTGLGSVSATAARYADCAVLVTRGEPRPVGTAVLALDGSDASLEALRFLSSLELGSDTTVRLLHVMDEVHLPEPLARRPLQRELEQRQAERRAEVERLLERAARSLAASAGAVERAVRVGDPAAEIVRAASEEDVDLVVVGARGLGTVKRLLLGSVSERLLRQAPCPVLVVKCRRPPR